MNTPPQGGASGSPLAQSPVTSQTNLLPPGLSHVPEVAYRRVINHFVPSNCFALASRLVQPQRRLSSCNHLRLARRSGRGCWDPQRTYGMLLHQRYFICEKPHVALYYTLCNYLLRFSPHTISSERALTHSRLSHSTSFSSLGVRHG